MRERRVSAVIVSAEGSIRPAGILTSKDILMRVLAVGKGASATAVSEVMTPHPECVPLHTPIVDALHTMHDGKFLHLPVVDRQGRTVACLDVIQLTHGAVASAAGGGAPGTVPTDNMMQQFWDSALALEPTDTEEDNHRCAPSPARRGQNAEHSTNGGLGWGGQHSEQRHVRGGAVIIFVQIRRRWTHAQDHLGH